MIKGQDSMKLALSELRYFIISLMIHRQAIIDKGSTFRIEHFVHIPNSAREFRSGAILSTGSSF